MMLSCDTNILVAALNVSSPDHEACLEFIQDNLKNTNFVMSEWVLIETYNLLRNPAVMPRPLGAMEAVELIKTLRSNRYWSLCKGTEDVAEKVWQAAATKDFPRRAIFDARIAFSLLAYGVSRFATRDLADFARFPQLQAFDPTASESA